MTQGTFLTTLLWENLLNVGKSIISNTLTALYQPFWFSALVALLFMFVWKSFSSIKQALKQWITWFMSESSFRRTFFLVFYTVMILFRTLLNRNLWLNPLSNVIGVWGLYNEKGELTTEVIENLALFVPFTVLLLWTRREKIVGKKLTLGNILWKSIKIIFLFSFIIEMLQLFLRLGTWQLSDLFYNTLGGAIGSVIYYIGYRIKHRGFNL